jgi:hypothetical protein
MLVKVIRTAALTLMVVITLGMGVLGMRWM